MGEYHISYKTKIVEITGVTMSGVLEYNNNMNSWDGWKVDNHNLSEFLDRFRGKTVQVSIEVLGVEDDAKLLPESRGDDEPIQLQVYPCGETVMRG